MLEVTETLATEESLDSIDLKSLAADVVAAAQKAGATDAEAVVSEGD